MALHRCELSDFEWGVIQPPLPNKPRGVPREDDRKVLNGIFWRLRTGSPWADIPERYGAPTTCYNRFVRWRKLGVWNRLFEAVSRTYDGDLQMVDSSSINTLPTSKRGLRAERDSRGCMYRSNRLHGALARRGDHRDPRPGGRQRQPGRAQADRGPGA